LTKPAHLEREKEELVHLEEGKEGIIEDIRIIGSSPN
jgi:hypothetical protein